MFIWWFSKKVVILSVGNEILILHLNYPNYSTMKNIIDRIIVLLFIFTMFFLMVVSAHAENRYFFTSQTMPSSIVLDDVTIMPTNSNGTFSNDPRTIFNESVTYFARIHSTKGDNTRFTINTQSKGILLVYYARSYDGTPIPNDSKDLNIENKAGVVEIYEKTSSNSFGVKYFILEAGNTYTMTAQDATCGVYGFVYMPGNVAAYNPKGKGDVSLFGQCCDSYANLSMPREENWYFGGWYKDEACTERVTDNMPLTEPTILFASWSRCVWDFGTYPTTDLRYGNTLECDGIVVYGSEGQSSYSGISSQGLTFLRQGSKDYNHATFVPKYDGELTLTYRSSNTDVNSSKRICAVGTEIVPGSDIDVLKTNSSVIACGETDLQNLKTIHAKLTAGIPYYIYMATTGGIYIPKMQYVASASSAVVDGENVSLTTTANMQGWHAFYDKDYSYTVDANTKVYMVVNSEVNGEVKFSNRTGNKVPKDCAVVLHTDALQADGTYLITMTRDETPYVYEGTDNLLRHSNEGEKINAYRLGYRSGEGNGVAFYPWSTTNSSEGKVYLYQPNNSGNAKIAFEIEESTAAITSVHKEPNECNLVFNLNGQRMAAPQKGFNIINGKKYIVR